MTTRATNEPTNDPRPSSTSYYQVEDVTFAAATRWTFAVA